MGQEDTGLIVGNLAQGVARQQPCVGQYRIQLPNGLGPCCAMDGQCLVFYLE